MPSNDEVERRGIAPTTNEDDLSQSSISFLGKDHQPHAPGLSSALVASIITLIFRARTDR
jgi:hypothetical protein